MKLKKSPRHLLKIEKARQLISSPNWGIVDFLSREGIVLEAVLGLLVYSLVVGKLHVLMLLFLCALFLAELFIGLKIEKKKQGYKEERARADRRMNYMAYGTKGIKEAKDIRVYSMIPMLREITNMRNLLRTWMGNIMHCGVHRHSTITILSQILRNSMIG